MHRFSTAWLASFFPYCHIWSSSRRATAEAPAPIAIVTSLSYLVNITIAGTVGLNFTTQRAYNSKILTSSLHHFENLFYTCFSNTIIGGGHWYTNPVFHERHEKCGRRRTHHMTWSLALGDISLRVRSTMKRFTVSNFATSPGSNPSESCKINRLLLLWRNSVSISAFPGFLWETSCLEDQTAERMMRWTPTALLTPKTLLINDDFPHPVWKRLGVEEILAGKTQGNWYLSDH